MEYACAKCGCKFACEIEIRFCPFCGTAYENAAGEQGQVSSVRIAIGSDSERVVQEKYWRKAHASLRRIFGLMKLNLPDEVESYSDQLNLHTWLNQQRNCRSSQQFKKQLRSFLKKIHTALQDLTLKEMPEPIDLLLLASRLEQTSALLLHTLGEKFLPKSVPQMVYEPVSPKLETMDAMLLEPCRQLLSAIEGTLPVFESILDENGVFVALSVLERVMEDEATAEPLSLIKQLSELAQKDYDPLFGEEYDDFVLVFWQSILCMAETAKRVLLLSEQDENEQNKMEAIEEYFSEWKDMLDIALDRLYESQTKSMIVICKELDEIEKECASVLTV